MSLGSARVHRTEFGLQAHWTGGGHRTGRSSSASFSAAADFSCPLSPGLPHGRHGPVTHGPWADPDLPPLKPVVLVRWVLLGESGQFHVPIGKPEARLSLKCFLSPSACDVSKMQDGISRDFSLR